MNRGVLLSILALTSVVVPLSGCADRGPDPEEAQASTAAITGGTMDTKHRAVAAILVDTGDGVPTVRCTGTLIAPTVVVTAGHCTYRIATNRYPAWVSFDDVLGTTPRKIAVQRAISYPGYDLSKMQDPTDIGVLLLARAVTAITPATLPSEGFLDDLASRGLFGKDSPTLLVGYGTTKSGAGQRFSETGQRMAAKVPVDTLHKEIVHNDESKAGGSCYGDSGGPEFFTHGGVEYLIATAIGGDGACTNLSYYNRTDTSMKRAFLRNYLP